MLLMPVILGLLLTCQSAAWGSIFVWSGSPIEGEDQTFLPTGSAKFEISGLQLKLTLTDTSQRQWAQGQALTALLWDLEDQDVVLAPLTAMIAAGSKLVGANAVDGITDLSSEWGFRSDIVAGPTQAGPLGSFGVSSVGEINFGDENPQGAGDSFGPTDRFDTSTNLFGPNSLNGTSGGIVGLDPDLTLGGFKKKGPLVQNQMVFTFDIIGGTLTDDEIVNVQPLFGSDGAPLLVPEPSTLIIWTLLGALGISFAWQRKRRTA